MPKTKAAILVGQNAPLAVGEIDIPIPEAGQVLVHFKASGICGAQINEISGAKGPDSHLPHLLGHEGAGIVEDIGPGVTTIKPGDHVVAHWRKGKGLEGACPKYRWGDKFAGGGWITTFNEYALISENRLTRIEPDIPFDIAALMGCSVTTGMGVVFNDAKLQPGQSIAVIGCGGVGLSVIMAADIAGAETILAVDVHASKKEMATKFWADFSGDIEQAKDFDVIVDTTGRPELIAKAYALVAPGGRIIMVGQPARGEALVLPDVAANFKGKALLDSQGGGTDPNTDIPKYLELYRNGALNLEALITHRFPLERVNEALDVVRSGVAGRVILEMT